MQSKSIATFHPCSPQSLQQLQLTEGRRDFSSSQFDDWKEYWGSGWFSGSCLPCEVQFWPRVVCGLSFSRSQPEGFFSGYSGFPPSEKSTPGQLHPAGFAVLRDHTWIVWRQPWAPSHAFGPIPLSRLTVKSPCRERSTIIFTIAFGSSTDVPCTTSTKHVL